MWYGIGPEAGHVVSDQQAYEYAKAHLDEMPEEDKQIFIEFFFSGNWVKEDNDESEL